MPPTGISIMRPKKIIIHSILQYQQHRQALWSFLLTHIDADVDHLIKLRVDFPQAALDTETDKLWIILRQWVTKNGSFMYQNLELNGKTITSTISFPKYLFRFQNFVDNFRSHPSPTDLECTDTLLAGKNSRWYSYIWHKYYGNTAVKPTYANLKADLL